MRLAEIRDIHFTVHTQAAKTEAELAYELMSMDLLPEIDGMYAPEGYAIAVKSSGVGANSLPIEVKDMMITISVVDKYSDDTSKQQDEEQFPPVKVPKNKYLVAQLANLRTNKNGLLVTLFGSQQVLSDHSSESYTSIRESAIAEITKINLPVKIGLIAQDKLINIEPVVFKPVGEI